MKNLICAILLASVGLVSCSSCASSNSTTSGGGTTATTEPTPVPSGSVEPEPQPKTETVVSRETWSFTLPEPWVLEEEECGVMGCAVALRSPDTQKMVVFVREEFADSLDAFVILSLRSLKGVGAEIISADPVEVNGHNFVLIKSSKNSIVVNTWATVSNNTAYSLSCGGVGDNTKLCTGVANSLTLQ